MKKSKKRDPKGKGETLPPTRKQSKNQSSYREVPAGPLKENMGGGKPESFTWCRKKGTRRSFRQGGVRKKPIRANLPEEKKKPTGDHREGWTPQQVAPFRAEKKRRNAPIQRKRQGKKMGNPGKLED